MNLDMRDVDSFLHSKGIPESDFENTAPHEVLRMFTNYSNDSRLLENLHLHFGKKNYDEQEAISIMEQFANQLQIFINQESLSREDSIKCAALLDIIFSFEAWLSFAGVPKEWGWSAVFHDFAENLYILNRKTESHLNQAELAALSSTRMAPTVLSALNKNVDSSWAGEQYEDGYNAMFSNSPNLTQDVIHRGLGDGDSTLVFHKNADSKFAKGILLEMLEEDPDPILEQLQGWQSMYENGWYFVTPWPALPHSKGLLKVVNTWLKNNDYDETVEDYLGFDQD